MKPAKRIISGIIISLIWIISVHAQPTDNVVAYSPFNGNANDVTGNGKNASILGATLTADRLGKANDAYAFNGSNGVMTLPNVVLTSSSAFAISCWVKIAGNHATSDVGQTIIDLRYQYQIVVSYMQSTNINNPSSFQFYIYSSPITAVIYSANNSVALNTWYHIVGNYGNNNMELYVNGILVGTQTITAPGSVPGYSNTYNTIGKDYSFNYNRGWVNGCIDEIIFYKRMLTSTEVQAIYNKELTQSELPELYAPISYSIDASGNRTGRNVIALKSASVINTPPDSAGMETTFADLKPKLDSLKYTDLDQKIKIYPNPTKGQLQTELSGFDLTQKSGIYVYNSAGKLLQQKVPASPTDVIDLSAYTSGVYIMRIIVDDKVSEWKILKE